MEKTGQLRAKAAPVNAQGHQGNLSAIGPEGDKISQMQLAADASPQVSQLRSVQAAADASPQVAQFRQQQAAATDFVTQRQENQTGLSDQLKSGIESLSGMAMDDVKVHYNSDKPAQMHAHAFAQGTDIHVAAGQEKHLPHEAWHVVQQKQGRVQATTQLKGMSINDDSALEAEADVMGAKAMQLVANGPAKPGAELGKGAVSANAPRQGALMETLTAMVVSMGLSPMVVMGSVAALGIIGVILVLKRCMSAGTVSEEEVRAALQSRSSGKDKDEVEDESEDEEDDDAYESDGKGTGLESDDSSSDDADNDNGLAAMMASSFGGRRRSIAPSKSKAASSPSAKKAATPAKKLTQSQYDLKVTECAQMIVREIRLREQRKAAAYGMVDPTAGWTRYAELGYTKKAFHNEVLREVQLTYPQSAASDRPYYNWVVKNGWISNYTQKERQNKDLLAYVNLHFI